MEEKLMNNIRFLSEAMRELRPLSRWHYLNENLNWEDDPDLRPSNEEIEAKVQEIIIREPMRLLRIHRNKLLAETDWVVSKYAEIGELIPNEWRNYRQVLRNLPDTATPVLDPSSPTGISGVDWPVKPE